MDAEPEFKFAYDALKGEYKLLREIFLEKNKITKGAPGFSNK